MSENNQSAPYPAELAALVAQLVYRREWSFYLEDIDRGQGSQGLTLIIRITTVDNYDQDTPIRVAHYFPVPPAAYDRRSWRRWLFDRIGQVELHEACEFFTIDGDKPYAPSHGPGNDPYLIREPDGTDIDRRTTSSGEIQ